MWGVVRINVLFCTRTFKCSHTTYWKDCLSQLKCLLHLWQKPRTNTLDSAAPQVHCPSQHLHDTVLTMTARDWVLKLGHKSSQNPIFHVSVFSPKITVLICSSFAFCVSVGFSLSSTKQTSWNLTDYIDQTGENCLKYRISLPTDHIFSVYWERFHFPLVFCSFQRQTLHLLVIFLPKYSSCFSAILQIDFFKFRF